MRAGRRVEDRRCRIWKSLWTGRPCSVGGRLAVSQPGHGSIAGSAGAAIRSTARTSRRPGARGSPRGGRTRRGPPRPRPAGGWPRGRRRAASAAAAIARVAEPRRRQLSVDRRGAARSITRTARRAGSGVRTAARAGAAPGHTRSARGAQHPVLAGHVVRRRRQRVPRRAAQHDSALAAQLSRAVSLELPAGELFELPATFRAECSSSHAASGAGTVPVTGRLRLEVLLEGGERGGAAGGDVLGGRDRRGVALEQPPRDAHPVDLVGTVEDPRGPRPRYICSSGMSVGEAERRRAPGSRGRARRAAPSAPKYLIIAISVRGRGAPTWSMVHAAFRVSSRAASIAARCRRPSSARSAFGQGTAVHVVGHARARTSCRTRAGRRRSSACSGGSGPGPSRICARANAVAARRRACSRSGTRHVVVADLGVRPTPACRVRVVHRPMSRTSMPGVSSGR